MNDWIKNFAPKVNAKGEEISDPLVGSDLEYLQFHVREAMLAHARCNSLNELTKETHNCIKNFLNKNFI